MTKKIYNYDSQSGAFVSETFADESPLEPGVFLIPANATDCPPPSPSHSWREGKWIVVSPLVVDPVVALTSAKADGLSKISGFAKSKRALIAGTSDDAEIAGWNNKLRIAQAIGAGTATDGEKAAFQAEITARGISGETLDIFCQKVIKNAGFFAQAVGLIDGLKRKGQDAVNAAKTPDEVTAVLAAIKQQAEAAFATLMSGR